MTYPQIPEGVLRPCSTRAWKSDASGHEYKSLSKKLENGHTFVLEIIEEGKVSCSEKLFLEGAIKIFQSVRKKFVKKETLGYGSNSETRIHHG
jgi:hypothetical protein